MGDPRAGSTGTTATAITPPTDPTVPATSTGGRTGKRVARHAAEQCTSTPYAGRRVAQVALIPAEPDRGAESLPYAGRRVAGRNPVVARPAPAEPMSPVGVGPVGRRVALGPELAGDAEDVVGHLLCPTAVPTLETYVGRRIAPVVDLITEPAVARPVVIPAPVVERIVEPTVEPESTPAPLAVTPLLAPPAPVVELVELVEESLAAAPAAGTPLVVDAPVLAEPVLEEPAVVGAAELVDPVLATHPELRVELPTLPPGGRVAPGSPRLGGRRAATRRTRLPSLPLLAGVAVLAISAGGALQAVHPGLAGANPHGRLSPASALSGSSAVGSASLLGGRDAVVSRDSDRQAASSGSGSSLQAAADAQAKQRDAALSAFAAQAEKQAAEIKLHQWVLPVTPGVYHLTARFGDYSSLWSHFHTGLDFAAPTGTPIMAVAGGIITEVGYDGAYGNRTIETLPDGTELWYCHQNSFGTSVGATVKPGQLIGYIGSTGNVTGAHLHLEVHPGGGDPVDPYTALVVHGLNP